MLRSLFKTFKSGNDAPVAQDLPAQPDAVTEAAPPASPVEAQAAPAPVSAPAPMPVAAPAFGSPEAIARAQAELARHPGDFHTLFQLAQHLAMAARHAEAEPLLREALALRPASQQTLHMLGYSLKALGRGEEAVEMARLAVAAETGSSNTRVLLAQTLFFAQRYREAFFHFRARAGVNGMLPDWTGVLSRWEGEPLNGQRLLVWLDWGGLGDELMFARYVPLLLERYKPAELHWIVLPQNHRLLAMLPGVTQVFSTEATLAVDKHIPLLDLPCLFGTDAGTIPAAPAYLRSDAADSARWAQRLSTLPGLKVGLCWASGHWNTDPEFERDRQARSMPLSLLAPLLDVPGVSVISLQKGLDRQGADAAAWQAVGERLHDYTAELGDMAQTAALIANLDLVVCVDTSVAHLAAALGKPVLLLAAWGIGLFWGPGERTAWYPSMRLIRQAKLGEWQAEAAQAVALVRACAERGRVALFDGVAH